MLAIIGGSGLTQFAALEVAQRRRVQTPWGEPFPGFAILGFIHDEYLHHRGQLYAYVRVFGIEPVMMWDFDHNAPEFQKRTAKA